jgi:hypothetical protein
MIRLTMVGLEASAVLARASPYFRVTGGVVWIQPDEGPIVSYSDDGWRHKGVPWPGMRFEGECRLVLGLPRDPTSVSEVLQSVSISSRVLCANGIPIAVYDDAQQSWQGVTASSWWPAFRIEIADLRKPLTKPTLRGDVIRLPDRREDSASRP